MENLYDKVVHKYRGGNVDPHIYEPIDPALKSKTALEMPDDAIWQAACSTEIRKTTKEYLARSLSVVPCPACEAVEDSRPRPEPHPIGSPTEPGPANV